MSSLAIIIEEDTNSTEPLFSFVGCGVIKAIFPVGYEKEDVRTCVNAYIKANRDVISGNLKKDTKYYRKKWKGKIDSICHEYGISKDLEPLRLKLRIAHSNWLIGVVRDIHGIFCELRVTINPLSFLMIDEAADTLLRLEILLGSLSLYKIVGSGRRMICMDGKEISVTEMRFDSTPYDQKYDELYNEYVKIKQKWDSEEIKAEYNRIATMTCVGCSI